VRASGPVLLETAIRCLEISSHAPETPNSPPENSPSFAEIPITAPEIQPPPPESIMRGLEIVPLGLEIASRGLEIVPHGLEIPSHGLEIDPQISAITELPMTYHSPSSKHHHLDPKPPRP